MINIKTATGYLDISDISLSLVQKSPIFNEVDGSCSYNFTLPATDNVRKIFNFPHRITKPIGEESIEVEIGFNGIYFIRGSLIVTESNALEYECSLGFSKGDFYYLVKDKSLRDLELGGERFFNSNPKGYADSYSNVVGMQYPDSDFAVFPVLNESFANPANEFYTGSSLFQNRWNNISIQERVTDFPTPFPFLVYVVKQIFEEHGFLIEENVLFIDEQLRKICIYNPILCKMSYSHNEYFINLNEHLPDVTIIEFLTEISKIGIRIFIDSLNKKVKIKLLNDIIKNNFFVNISDNVEINPINLNSRIQKGFKFSFTSDSNDAYWTDNVQEDLLDNNILTPVNTYNDLLLLTNILSGSVCKVIDEDVYYIYSIDDLGNMQWEYFSKNINSKYSDGIISDTNNILNVESKITPLLMVDDYIEKTTPPSETSRLNQICKVISWIYAYPQIGGSYEFDGTIYTNAVLFDPTGQPIPAGYYVYINQIGALDLCQLAHPITIPKCAIKGNYRNFKTNNGFTGFGIRLLFNYGFQHLDNYPYMGDIDGLYPLGSSDVFDYTGTQITDAYFNLFIDKDDRGIVDTFYKIFSYYIINIAKMVTVNKQFSILELRKLDFSAKHLLLEQNFLLNEVRVTITDNKIEIAEIDAYTCF